MTTLTVIKAIALIIFAVAVAVIYHNTNAYEPTKRIIYIIGGTIAVYIVTSIIFTLTVNGMNVKSEAALEDTLSVMKMMFTPINSMIVLATLGNVFGKLKDKAMETDKAGKVILIMMIILIVVLVVESNYVGGFVHSLLV